MTELAMPPVISMSSDDVEEDVAFQVINQDNLPITIQTILKPFGQILDQKQKPNGIVYPTRRIEPTNLEESKQKSFTKSHGHINSTTQEKNFYNLRKHHSASHGNLHHTNSSSKFKLPEPQIDQKFTKTLDAKLRKLQKEFAANKKDKDWQRRPFVTTVKKGQFLEPPPEIASLIGIKIEEKPIIKKEEKKLYAYSSQPRVLNRTPSKTVHKTKCEAAAKAAASLAGSIVGLNNIDINYNRKSEPPPMPYSNLMHEKRVCRGTTVPHQPKWNPNFAYARLLSREGGDGESAAARAAEARRREMARRKAKAQQIRAAELRIKSPPPVCGRKHEPVQTEQYLEEIWENPDTEEVCTQTELFLHRPVSPYYIPAKVGIDAETQIYPGDLFDFDMEVQPILEVLVGKTLEQALIEVLEEEEIASLREQQRKFLELRAAELAETQRLEERDRRLRAEKQRRVKEYESGVVAQKQLEERVSACILTQGSLSELLPSVIEGLEAEGFLTDCIKDDIDEEFMPWLIKEVTCELCDIVSSRDILVDIVREILENRAELYRILNMTPRPEEYEEGCGPPLVDLELLCHERLKEEVLEIMEKEEKK